MNDTWYSTDGVHWSEATAAAAFPGRFDFPAVVLGDRMWVIAGASRADALVGNDTWYSSGSPAGTVTPIASGGYGIWPYALLVAAIAAAVVVYAAFFRKKGTPEEKKPAKKDRKKKK
jgi:hypothetical protein